MTSLRFIGDLPVWWGLLLSLLVGGMSWRYYSRESFDLPRRLKWFLPLLRSLAFFLGIMMLTGPVLHHRKTIGELGRVKVYIDASNSMTMQDRHMSVGRKLLIAEQLGWLNPGSVDATLLNLADDLAAARRQFLKELIPQEQQDDSNPSDVQKLIVSETSYNVAIQQFQDRLKSVQPQLPETDKEKFVTELLDPLGTFAANNAEKESQGTKLRALATVCESIETSVRAAFEESLRVRINSSDSSFQTALAMFDETPRWRRAELGLSESTQDVLTKLREQHDVEVLSLHGESAVLHDVSIQESNQDAPPRKPDFSNITDLSSGIVSSQSVTTASRETENATQKQQTAIVLIADGQHNSGPSPLQTARVLGRQGQLFYCVSIGATQPATDLAVIGLEHPDLIFRKDRVRGVMIISDSMPVGKPFVVQISYEDEVLWQQQLLTQNMTERRIEFEFVIDELVDRLGTQFASDVVQHVLPLEFTASIAPLIEESETANNQLPMRMAAITQSDKLLIIDGRSRWETRYLRNAFARDEKWQVNTIIAGAGAELASLPRGDQNDQFPTSRDALFEYGMIIFGEVAPELFTEQEFDWLREFVEIRGGGMVFIDGQRGTLRKLTEQSLGDLFPVNWLGETVTSPPTTLHLTEKGARVSALKLAVDEQQNRRFWTDLPAPHTLVAVEALPGAEVLIEANVDGKQRPVMVTRQYGAGRVLYLAFDETWRWRYKAADLWHQRIWNQLAQFVMPRPFAVSDEYVSLDTGSVSYQFGDSVDVRVRLLGLDGKPAIDATADALVWKDGRIVSTIGLNADADIPGIYRGRTESMPEGEYEVSVRASGYSDSVLKARSEFVVLPPESGEMTQTSVNEDLLRQMATASGGVYLREEELGQLPELLSPLSSGRVVESETLIWQSYWWFAMIILLLSMEWILRKRAGLL